MTSPKEFPIYRLETRIDLAAVKRLEQLAKDAKRKGK